jgi:hypothetical protein
VWLYVHELAHAIHYLDGRYDRDEAGHGPEFCGVLVKLAEYVIGSWMSDRLVLCFNHHGVKIAHTPTVAMAAGPRS